MSRRSPAAALVRARLASSPVASPARPRLIAALLASTVASACTLAFAVLLADAIATAFPGGPGPPGGSALGQLSGHLLALGGVVALRSASQWVAASLTARAGELVATDLRVATTEALVAAGRGRRRAPGPSDPAAAAAAVVDGADAVRGWVTDYLPTAAMAVVTPASVMALVFVLDAPTTLILAFTGPMLILLLAVIGRRTAELTGRRQVELEWLRSLYLDLLAGMATLRSFGRSREGAELVRATSQRFANRTLEVLRTAFQTSLVMEWAATAATALVAVEVSFRLTRGDLAFGPALAVLVVTPEFFAPFRALALAYHSGSSGDAAATGIGRLLDAGGTDGEPATAPRPRVDPGPPGVELAAVSHTYPGAASAALRGLDLEIGAGQTIALCGPSGAGKSTLAAILVGLVEPDRGTVRAAGRDLEEIGLDQWRELVAWVPQRPTVFAGTVAHNISLGRPTADRAALEEAARRACAADFIEALPAGYDTVLGESGVGLSGGQRQRLALACRPSATPPLVGPRRVHLRPGCRHRIRGREHGGRPGRARHHRGDRPPRVDRPARRPPWSSRPGGWSTTATRGGAREAQVGRPRSCRQPPGSPRPGRSDHGRRRVDLPARPTAAVRRGGPLSVSAARARRWPDRWSGPDRIDAGPVVVGRRHHHPRCPHLCPHRPHHWWRPAHPRASQLDDTASWRSGPRCASSRCPGWACATPNGSSATWGPSPGSPNSGSASTAPSSRCSPAHGTAAATCSPA
ncbi:MAG: ATP-binding cassette domain-containing protein [Microthrixaceae bacterium]